MTISFFDNYLQKAAYNQPTFAKFIERKTQKIIDVCMYYDKSFQRDCREKKKQLQSERDYMDR